jgi:hypothetical protein
VEEKILAPLELIHSNLCEMNEILTKGEKDISYLLLMTLLDGFKMKLQIVSRFIRQRLKIN